MKINSQTVRRGKQVHVTDRKVVEVEIQGLPGLRANAKKKCSALCSAREAR